MEGFSQILCFIILFAFINLEGISQISEDSKQDFSKAEKFLDSKKYKDALPLYLAILDSEPDNTNINYRVGQCYINLLGKERESLPYLKKAVQDIDADYKPGNTKSFGASPYAWFLLGDAYHRDEMLSEASKAYNNYKQYVADDKHELTLISERIIGLGVTQGEVRDHPPDVVLSNLGEEVNTKSSEYNIIFSGDLKTRVFNRYEKRSDIVFYSIFENGGWSSPVEISEQIGSQGDMYATALSYDGKELYLVMLTAYDADIYISEFSNGTWSYAENAGRNINTKYVESNASISADGNTLYFSSDRASSIGGFDIFYSKKVNGKWGKSENLGEIINTKSNEESPFIVNSGNTLYFSSDRPGTMGRMDVYFSRLENDMWSNPENMGMPYNSVEDDIAFKYYEKYKKSYIARDLPGGFGKLDLYLIQSGKDRQQELMDYMASIAPPKTEQIPEVTEEPLVVEEITEEDPVVETEEENFEVSIEAPPVMEVAAVVAVAEVIVKDEPAIIEPIEQEEVNEVVPEPIEESNPEPIIEPTPEPYITPIIEEIPETNTEPIIESIPEVVEESIVSEPQVFEGDYTVQILALIFPKRISNYNGLDASLIKSISGDDGYTRFVYGQYKSIDEALKALKLAFSKGYADAYIRRTSEIDNFQ